MQSANNKQTIESESVDADGPNEITLILKMRLGHDVELVYHEFEDERNPEYWYFHYYGETVNDEKISVTYESREEAMKAFKDKSIKWEAL